MQNQSEGTSPKRSRTNTTANGSHPKPKDGQSLAFDSVKIFSATKARERVGRGDRATEWIREESPKIVKVVVRQSSDSEFHCITLVFFYQA